MDEQVQNEYESRWHRLIEAFNNAVEEVFDTETDRPVIVIGAQWGEMGHDTEVGHTLPQCLVTSNLPVCFTEQAVEDMLISARRIHAEFHGEAFEEAGFPMSLDDVPEEVRAAALAAAEAAGLGPESIRIYEVPDTSDLDNPQAALNIPEVNAEGLEGTD